jgi:hypothetical protein
MRNDGVQVRDGGENYGGDQRDIHRGRKAARQMFCRPIPPRCYSKYGNSCRCSTSDLKSKSTVVRFRVGSSLFLLAGLKCNIFSHFIHRDFDDSFSPLFESFKAFATTYSFVLLFNSLSDSMRTRNRTFKRAGCSAGSVSLSINRSLDSSVLLTFTRGDGDTVRALCIGCTYSWLLQVLQRFANRNAAAAKPSISRHA